MSDGGPRLLLSDSPEYVVRPGIVYRDWLEGDCRIFFYHVNRCRQPARVSVRLDNLESRPVQVQIRQRGLAWPDRETVLVGKATMHHWLTDRCRYPEITIDPGGHSELDPDLGQITIWDEQLINGIYDLSCNGRVMATIAMIPRGQTDEQFWAGQPEWLPRDGVHPAGTFAAADRQVVLGPMPPPGRVAAVTLADGRVDRFLVGTDPRTDQPVINHGNYGVRYTIVNRPADQPAGYDLYLAALGGVFGSWLGVSGPDDGIEWLPVPASGWVNAVETANGKRYPVEFVASLRSAAGQWLIFSPPGGSALPVRLVLEATGPAL
ncbi:MAG: hypothetical protein N3A57_02140 [Negativicutes bacterium]|nr:hypothetical protein [Negativicutes bacterium]